MKLQFVFLLAFIGQLGFAQTSSSTSKAAEGKYNRMLEAATSRQWFKILLSNTRCRGTVTHVARRSRPD